jgi:serine/threonine protein kinase
MYCTEHNTPGVPESISRIWLAQLLHAIRDMSSCGVAHRDVKLENCLLTKEGNVILADLELGLECSSLGGEENGVEILGTPL